MEAAKALGGSFKLVQLAPKNCKGDDSTAQGNIKERGHTNTDVRKSDDECIRSDTTAQRDGHTDEQTEMAKHYHAVSTLKHDKKPYNNIIIIIIQGRYLQCYHHDH